jgi:hypothetical protein
VQDFNLRVLPPNENISKGFRSGISATSFQGPMLPVAAQWRLKFPPPVL